MRQVVLDTETTGLEIKEDHRIIEIGCVEIVGRKVTRRHYHQYINPERDIDDGALEVHGITRQFLMDKPRFAEVWEGFLEFVDGSGSVVGWKVADLKTGKLHEHQTLLFTHNEKRSQNVKYTRKECSHLTNFHIERAFFT